MKKFNLIPLFLGLFTMTFAFGQETEVDVRTKIINYSENQLLTEASMYTQDGFLFFAEILTDKLITFKPESSNYNYRKGFLVLQIRKDHKAAIPYLEKAVKTTSANYDMYSTKEQSAPTDAFFHLATCYHLNEDIVKAEENYTKFIQTSKQKSELIPVAKLRLEQCAEAKVQMKTPVNVYLRNVGSTINTQYPEYSPVVSLDGSALYFTSRRPWSNGETELYKDEMINQYPEDVYVSYMDFDSTWTSPMRLDFCLPMRNEATLAVSSDERKIYLYQDTTGNGDIYYTDFYHAKFQEITKLEIEGVNTDDWETHCMMSHDKKMLLFVSDRKGGFGGRDIYMMTNDGKGNWSKPINLGPGINGPNDEDAPFISIDNKTLYFSSNGANSIGGFDIFYSSLNADGTWSDAKNLGYPFNSTNDDIFYTTTIDGLKGYMTSFRGDGYGEKDIYEIHNDYLGVNNIAVLRGLIKTVDNKPIPEDFAVSVKLICLDCEDQDNARLVFPRLRDGVFMTALEPCKTYRLEYMNASDNKIMHEDGFTTDCTEEYQEIYKELLLDVDSRTIIVPEVPEPEVGPEFPELEFMHYFTYNKNTISTGSGDLKVFVEGVVKQLNDGRENVTISIYSSASNVPTATYKTNQNLAHIRAENMKKELLKYFEGKEELKGKIDIIVGSELVQGPEYEKDAGNHDKYKPYQYVGLKTN